MILTRRSKFDVPRLTIYRTLCEGLETAEGIMDAIECFHHMTSELTEVTITQDEQAGWVLGEYCMLCRCRFCDHDFRSDFRYRCSEKLEHSGDCSTALSIHPTNTQRYFILRSKVSMAQGLWEDALNDANEVGSVTLRKLLHIEAA